MRIYRNDILLKKMIVSNNRVMYYFDVRGDLKRFFNRNTMYVEYDFCVENIPEGILVAPFVANMLPIIWLTNGVLWLQEIDRTLYDSLPRLREAYQDLYENVLLNGRVISARLPEYTYEIKRESLLLFSGGLDAHVSYLRIKESNPVLCNIQGWYPNGLGVQSAEADYKDISNFALRHNLNNTFVKSDFATLIDNDYFERRFRKKINDSLWHGFQHSMCFITIAIPIAWLYGIKKIYIASSFSLRSNGQCASYATTDVEFKFAMYGRCVHDAFEMSRQEKVHYLVEEQKKIGTDYPIRVCSFNDHNCCICDKCIRTILELIAENAELPKFGFKIHYPLKAFFIENVLPNIIKLDIAGESIKHWPDIKKRMKENYENIQDKEFIDWFLTFDFKKARQHALWNYYYMNFFNILKRKINRIFQR